MVEVKTKNQWVAYRGRVETGINQRLFEHYKLINELTNKKVFLIFNHKEEEPTGYFMAELKKHTRIWDGIVNGINVHPAMVFYDFNILTKL